jgi:hypothetical protein
MFQLNPLVLKVLPPLKVPVVCTAMHGRATCWIGIQAAAESLSETSGLQPCLAQPLVCTYMLTETDSGSGQALNAGCN